MQDNTVVYSNVDLRNSFRKNPILSSFSSYLPTNIKDIFKWCEFIVSNVSVAAAGIEKLSETTVTSFKYHVGDDFNETNLDLKDSWKQIIEKKLGLKSKLLEISYNLEVYNNVFISVYKPFNRTLKCKKCKRILPITAFPKVKLKLVKRENEQKHNFKDYDYTTRLNNSKKVKEELVSQNYCESCKEVTEHEIIDINVNDISKVNVILWNPHNIDIEYNPVSGKSTYYYNIDDNIKKGITNNSRTFVETTPKEMITAVLSKKKFKLNNKSMLHIKKGAISGVSTVWGLPKLVSAIPSVLTYLIYNKANEKIAMDYLVPLRTVYPESNGQGEMYSFMSGDSVAAKLKDVINKWKLDPSGVQVTPFPIGTQQILGDGRMLNLDQELANKETNIANALGVPIEFIKGGLSYGSQGPALRLLENQMAKNQYDLNRVIKFIIDEVSFLINKEPINVELLPFKLIDDLQEKATIVQLAAQGGGMISTGTLLELFNMDSNTERKRSIEENKMQTKQQMELQHYQQQVQQSIEEKAKQENILNQSNFNSLNTQALMQEAQQYVDQMAQMDEGQRRSQLDELSKTNYILYATVKSLLDMSERKQIYQAGKRAVSGQ
jgi:hypothetical protein